MIDTQSRWNSRLVRGVGCLALALLAGCVLDDPIGAEARGETRSAGVDRSMGGLSVEQGPDGEEQLSIDRSIDFGERSEVDEMLRPDRDR